MTLTHDKDTIYLKNEKISIEGRTDFTPELWDKINSTSWSFTKKNDKYKYIYSRKMKLYLHQMVVDFYYSEDFRKKKYEKNWIIEHLNNNGCDCKISNLAFLNNYRNVCKGWKYDIDVEKIRHKFSIQIFNVFKSRTFQITVAFNQPFLEPSTNQLVDTLRFFYSQDYEVVFQDADIFLDYLMEEDDIDFLKLRNIMRFIDFSLVPMDRVYVNEDLPSGSIIDKNGQYLMVQKFDGEILKLSSSYDPDWGLKKEKGTTP